MKMTRKRAGKENKFRKRKKNAHSAKHDEDDSHRRPDRHRRVGARRRRAHREPHRRRRQRLQRQHAAELRESQRRRVEPGRGVDRCAEEQREECPERGLCGELGEEVREDRVAAVAAGGALALDDLALLFFFVSFWGENREKGRERREKKSEFLVFVSQTKKTQPPPKTGARRPTRLAARVDERPRRALEREAPGVAKKTKDDAPWGRPRASSPARSSRR